MTTEEQARLRKLKSDQMKARRQDPELEAKRLNTLRQTVASKSDEQKARLYDNRRGDKASNRKSVKTPLGIFSTLTAAAKAHDVTVTTVSNRCNNVAFTEWEWL